MCSLHVNDFSLDESAIYLLWSQYGPECNSNIHRTALMPADFCTKVAERRGKTLPWVRVVCLFRVICVADSGVTQITASCQGMF